MDLANLGRIAAPAIEAIPRKLIQCTCATLCTPDGFNLCSIGITAERVGKISALTSSLISLGDAMQIATGGNAGEIVDVITLQAGASSTVGIKVPLATQSHLLLLVTAQSAPLGALLTVARSSAAEVRKLLSDEAVPAPGNSFQPQQ